MVPHPVRAQDCSRLPQERKSSRLSRCKTLLLLLQYSDLHQWTIWRREGRMPYANMPWIQQGQLVLETGPRIPLDSPAWFRWLETATHFCYTSSRTHDRLTARKEKRRHTYYWYGYLRNASKLHNMALIIVSAISSSSELDKLNPFRQNGPQFYGMRLSHEDKQ